MWRIKRNAYQPVTEPCCRGSKDAEGTSLMVNCVFLHAFIWPLRQTQYLSAAK